MFNPFQKLELIKAEVFMSMPAKFRKKARSGWSDPNRQGAEVECFLEGPSFDRDGNLWFVDIPFGRIFRISPEGDWELITQYDGWPNGLKFHKDGRAFITCYKHGLMALDTQTGKLETVLGNKHHHHLANLCFGGPDGKTIYITESMSGDILTARMPVAGKTMYGLS